MGLKIYEVKGGTVEETQKELERLRKKKRKEGVWGRDELLILDMPILDYMRIKSAVKQATNEQEWDLSFCQVDMHGKIELPLVYEGYVEYVQTRKQDYLSGVSPLWYIMTKRMLDVILSAKIHATSYPVAILDREIIKRLAYEIIKVRPEGINDEDIDKLIQEFRPNAEIRYYMLHLLEQYEIFDKEKSNLSENKYVFLEDLSDLPHFFRVGWGPNSALLCTEEGKKKLEDAQLLGLRFEELETIEVSD